MSMVVFLVAGGVLLAASIAIREWQWARERRETRASLRSLTDNLDKSQRNVRRLQEDVYVLQTVLRERNLLSENELAQARDRLIEQPKRVAAERDAIQRHLNIGVPVQVIEESLNKVH